jgi:NAD+ diphosphatase
MLKSPAEFRAIAASSAVESSDSPMTFFFRANELLVAESGSEIGEIGASHLEPVLVGALNGRRIDAVRVEADANAPSGTRWAGLRSLFGVLADDLVALAGRSLQLLEWDRTHRFCGACAALTVRETSERARRCPSCGLSAYPRISPAMMCLVTRGKQILLARNVNFPPNRYSALAGFVEAGESVEDAIHREVEEEVGIRVKDIRYFASQSWPFPNSLMIAYTAEYDSGELKPNGVEIAEADWFDRNNLPQLPPKVSIARALIDDTLMRLY